MTVLEQLANLKIGDLVEAANANDRQNFINESARLRTTGHKNYRIKTKAAKRGKFTITRIS